MPIDLKSMTKEQKVALLLQLKEKADSLRQRLEIKKARQSEERRQQIAAMPEPALLVQQPSFMENITNVGYLMGTGENFLAGVAQGGESVTGVLDVASRSIGTRTGMPFLRETWFGKANEKIKTLRREHEGSQGFAAGEFVGKAAEGIGVYLPVAAGVAATGGSGTLAAPILAGVATGGMEQVAKMAEGEDFDAGKVLTTAATFAAFEAGGMGLKEAGKIVKHRRIKQMVRDVGEQKMTREAAQADLLPDGEVTTFMRKHDGGSEVRSGEYLRPGTSLKTNVAGKRRDYSFKTKAKGLQAVKARHVKAVRDAELTAQKRIVQDQPREGSSIELGSGIGTPRAYSELITIADDAARAVGSKLLPDKMKRFGALLKTEEAQAILDDVRSIEETAATKIIGPTTEAFRRLGLYSVKNRFFKSGGEKVMNDLRTNATTPYRAVLDAVWNKAREVGVDIGRRVGYAPQILSSKYGDAFLTDLEPVVNQMRNGVEFTNKAVKKFIEATGSKETKELFAELTAKHGLTHVEAVQYIAPEAAPGILPASRFAKQRPFTLDARFTENNATVALTRYTESMGKYIAQAERWGKDGRGLEAKLSLLQEGNIGEFNRIKQFLDVYSGKSYTDYWSKKSVMSRNAWQAYQSGTFLTKIGLGLSTIPQIVQTLGVSAARAGYIRTVFNYAKVLASPAARARARELGLANPDIVAVFGGHHPSGALGKAADAMVTINGFKGINKLNSYASALSAEGAVNHWYRVANSGKETVSAGWAKNNLKRLGIDHTKPLTEEIIANKMYRFATDSQLLKSIADEPIFMTDPSINKWLLLKRYGIKQAVAVKDLVLKDAIVRNEAGRIVGYNPLPAARLALFGFAGGEAIIWARNIIKESLSGRPQYRKEDMATAERIIDDFAMSGAFGVVSEVATIFDDIEFSGKRASQIVLPVVAGDVSNIIEASVKLAKYWSRVDDAELAMKKNMKNLVAPFGAIVSQLATRTKTIGQEQNEIKSMRGNERGAILDLFIEGESKAAMYRIDRWNENYPQYAFTAEDINHKEMTTRYKRKLRNNIEEQ